MEHSHYYDKRQQLMQSCAMCDSGMEARHFIMLGDRKLPITKERLERLKRLNVRLSGDEISFTTHQVRLKGGVTIYN